MALSKALVSLVLMLAAAALLSSIAYGVIGWKQVTGGIRGLGEFILYHTYNIYDKTWWAGSPEAVTSIIWDYRGIDTVFETIVLYAAITGCLVLWSGLGEYWRKKGGRLTLVVRTATKILFAIILITSFNIALHGYITPGGGFAGGATFAVAPLLLLAAYGIDYLRRRGYRISRSKLIRSAALLLLALIVFIPFWMNGYLLENQAKPHAGFPGYPVYLGPLYIGGSLIYLNVFEFLVVAMEFIIVFIVFTIIWVGEKK